MRRYHQLPEVDFRMIRIGVLGRIMEGDEAGKFVLIKELPDAPPSYLVLTGADEEFKRSGGDEWVEDYPSLISFFQEARWVVEWR
ncbi:hypothetical protein [Planotetraspora kaengkrachanensis]|uniref:Uncharacterized protein n=1 Tax=Planotetraspora kaengkrachanensis TaxID=575193 RepID=A0A8J3M1D6_9ACTN|nr:hypothetical protein [Planotetraspora kaengkrachanensis]GIG80585.1 hypothetical protein Pka01_37120 [Planotetraspora kaengkrachanensis]